MTQSVGWCAGVVWVGPPTRQVSRVVHRCRLYRRCRRWWAWALRYCCHGVWTLYPMLLPLSGAGLLLSACACVAAAASACSLSTLPSPSSAMRRMFEVRVDSGGTAPSSTGVITCVVKRWCAKTPVSLRAQGVEVHTAILPVMRCNHYIGYI